LFSDLKDETRQEIWGVVLISLTVLAYLALTSDATGGFGELAQRVLSAAFGRAAWVVPGLVGAAGLLYIFRKGHFLGGSRAVGWVLVVAAALGWLHLYEFYWTAPDFPSDYVVDEFHNVTFGLGGGLVGAAVTWALRQAFGRVGRDVVLATLTLVALLVATDVSLIRFLTGVRDATAAAGKGLARGVVRFIGLFEEAGRAGSRADPAGRSERGRGLGRRERPTGGSPAGVSGMGPAEAVAGGGPGLRTTTPAGGRKRASAAKATRRTTRAGGVAAGGRPGYQQMALTEDVFYELPPLSLLEPAASPAKTRRARQDADEKARILEETLESFGVRGKVVDVRRGPVVTCFEFQPAPGVKVARIVGLADDIALNLASRDVRIEAPIPGKRAVGIEVPNQEVAMVPLRAVLEDSTFVSSNSKLTLAFGKDITGRPVTGDLERLLHILIAGATGSGKSVCINSIIASILFQARPNEVKLLLIDPKMVELSTYDSIPHLVAPVVTDPKKAAGCLRWAVKQMEERYELFAAAGVRDIGRYNALVARHREEGPAVRLPVHPRRDSEAGLEANAGTVSGRGPADATGSEGGPGLPQPLPYIVIVIDELADLMMVAPVDVEDAIWRLAQMARAAGIHLVVATQRPSVDVITGTIKANIPTRVAFAVSSQVDSRTIIDSHGAEKLLGHGDMLFLPVGATKPIRVQGAYVSDQEIETLVDFVRAQGRPRYLPDVLTEEESSGEEPEKVEDELFEDAVRVVMESGQASISMLQRKLRVGYTRAGRLIDMMEDKGIVGPFEGSKAREILMTWDQYRRLRDAARRAVDEADSAAQAAVDEAGARPGRPPVITLPGGRRLAPPDEDDDEDEYIS